MRRPPALWLALLAALLVLALPPDGAAQDDPYDEPLSVENAGLLTCVVGAGRLVTLPEQVERIAVADETLARVQIISPKELLITGLRPGESTTFRAQFRDVFDVGATRMLVSSLDLDVGEGAENVDDDLNES